MPHPASPTVQAANSSAPNASQPAAPIPNAWITRRWFTASGAAVAELASGIEPQAVFERLAHLPHTLFLDSALVDGGSAPGGPAEAAGSTRPAPAAPRLGRHSFVAADPIHSVIVEPQGDATDPDRVAAAFAGLRGLLADLAVATIPGLPPFQGGLAGLVSYECGLARIGVIAPRADVPLVSLHLYDVVCAFDHDTGHGWIISQGVPARGPTTRRQRAAERLDAVLAALAAPGTSPAPTPDLSPASEPPASMAATMTTTHSRERHVAMVRAGIELVRAGDIFQANLAQRMSLDATIDPIELHRRSRRLNPAPFAACFAAGGGATIVSMSPERLQQVSHGTVRMHPIKGTRRVLSLPEADLFAGEDLGGSVKDRAENVMIVDLVRNDLARVCRPESVRVEALCRLERYRYVQHLVSIVAGRLRPGLTALDALDAAIPGGSVTGAPKHRACEIIRDLEGFPRGAYCGSLGYVGLDGTADWNLLIRTFVVTPTGVSFAVGGGITAASDPAAEHAEALHKAEGMLRVLATFGAAPTPEAAR
ncbi:MAG: Aminodeoxychorismate synthase component 1 [Planctomycetota bacterium]|jgi:para-aminobenzoate synthetase component 1